MKNRFLIIIILATLFFPLLSLAGEYIADGKTIYYKGLVPCGKSEASPGESSEVKLPCQFCHFFVMFKGIFDFVLKLVIVIAVLMLTIGGFLFFFGGGSPKTLDLAKRILTSTAIGLIIIFSAWLIVNTIFMFIGVAKWTGLKEGWFSIECPIKF